LPYRSTNGISNRSLAGSDQCRMPKRNKGSIMLTDHARNYAEAEALFKKQDAHREESKAREEYQARERAMREKTARLRALRLARDQAKQRSAT